MYNCHFYVDNHKDKRFIEFDDIQEAVSYLQMWGLSYKDIGIMPNSQTDKLYTLNDKQDLLDRIVNTLNLKLKKHNEAVR